MTEKTTPYLRRYEHLQEKPAVSDKIYDQWLKHHSETPITGVRFPGHLPKIAFLDRDSGVRLAGNKIKNHWPVIVDYFTTYGTAFLPDIRQQIAITRRETLPLAPVSLVATYDFAIQFLDYQRLHPNLHQPVRKGALKILENLSFVRFPLHPKKAGLIHPSAVSPGREVQFFFVPDNDPLMSYLRIKYGIQYIAVRSSNITGEPEESFAEGSLIYAAKIGAPVLAIRSRKAYLNQNKRLRLFSQPIFRLPLNNENPVIKLTRSGSTHPDAMPHLLEDFAGFAEVIHEEEKISSWRTGYNPLPKLGKNHRPQDIRQALLKASGL